MRESLLVIFYSLVFTLLLMILGNKMTNAETILLTQNNSVNFQGEVNHEMVSVVIQDLYKLHYNRKDKLQPIYLVMDSPGGSIGAAIDFVNAVKQIPTLKTVTIFAASAASFIVQALRDERLIISTGVMMFHRASGGFEGQFEKGELESQLNFSKEIVIKLETVNSNRMKISLKKYKNLVKDELWQLGNKAILGKSADEIVTIVCNKQLLTTTKKNVIFTFFGQLEVELSNCPLLRMPIKISGGTSEDRLKLWNQNKLRVQNKVLK